MDSANQLLTLQAERLCLRWLEEPDAPDLFAIFSHPEVTRYWSTPPMTQVQQAQELVESIQRKFATGSLFQWGIAHRDSERVIGTCTLAEIYRQNRRAEIGFALNLEFWGQGLAQEAVRAVLRYAFQELDLMRIEADIDPRNAGSIRTCEQLGFVREGYLRERWIVAGEVCDTVFYGLLRKEFT